MGGRKGGLEKTASGVATCLERGADWHMAQLLPLTVSCFSKIPTGFPPFLAWANYPGSPG